MIGKHFFGRSRYLALMIVLVGLLVLLIPTSLVRADSVVTFPDPNLEAAIREAIGKPTGDIYQTDLDGLHALNAASRGIVDLTGLEYCTGLGEQYGAVDLSYNQISNISPLSGRTFGYTTGIGGLNLSHNQISDISPLVTVFTQNLNLSYNQISDISPLAGWIGVRFLNLSSNQISDLSALSGLAVVQSLYLANNQISDIQPLLDVSFVPPYDSGVDLRGNPLSCTSTSVYIPQLLASGTITVYYDNPIVVFPDSNLEAAIREAIGKPTGDIYQSDLCSLASLDASSRGIVDLAGLEHCTNLGNYGSVNLSHNQISDLAPLSGLGYLGSQYGPLFLSYNQISDLSPLAGHDYNNLFIDHNQISDLSPLGYSMAYNLNFSHNQISDISPLSGLRSVRFLNLSYNQISDIKPLVDAPIGPDDIDLRGNPLSCTSTSVYIPQLLASGTINVYYDLTIVVFPDPNLEGAIREAIGKPTGDIYQSDLCSLTSLYASSRGIVDLAGLEHCVYLCQLILADNQISDISPLANLTSLSTLILNGNETSDIEPLVNNTGISGQVYLPGNPLNCASIYTYIPALQARGVEVFWDVGPVLPVPEVAPFILLGSGLLLLGGWVAWRKRRVTAG